MKNRKIRLMATIAGVAAMFSTCFLLNSCSGGGGAVPAAPTGLAVAIGANAGELVISWTASDGATSYNIYWGDLAGVTKAATVDPAKAMGTRIQGVTSPYTHTGLTNGTRYYYVVTAVNANGESAVSTEANGLPQINPVGILDTDLAGTGYVQYTTNTGWGSGAQTDSLGRTVIAGRVWLDPNWYMALWRYNADGSLDNTFGGGTGLVMTHNTAGGTTDWNYGNDVAIDALGRILVTGSSVTSAPTYSEDMIIWRLSSDGTPDTSFGSGGYVTFDRGVGGNDFGNRIVIDQSGRILVAGVSASALNNEMALWRYTSAGDLDMNFGSGGVVFQQNAAGGNASDEANGLAINANGGIAVVGNSINTHSPSTDLVVWRFTDAGVLDTTFSADGIALFSGGYNDSGNDVTFDAQGRVVVTGQSDNATNSDFVVLRFTPSGALDTSFSGDGVVIYDSGYSRDAGFAIRMDSRQRIVAVGRSGLPASANDMAAIRLNDDGSFDTTFDGDGVVLFQLQPVSRNDGSAVAFDATGRIVIGGSVNLGPPVSMTFWRYE